MFSPCQFHLCISASIGTLSQSIPCGTKILMDSFSINVMKNLSVIEGFSKGI